MLFLSPQKCYDMHVILAIFFVKIQGKMSVFSPENCLKIHVRAYHVSVYRVTHI